MKKTLIIISLISFLSMNLLLAYRQLPNKENLIQDRSFKVNEFSLEIV